MTQPPLGARYPSAEVRETHISTVFLAGERAYKLLKPIRTAFLDFESVEARLDAATTEVEVNRRMAPDVYLGTADIIEDGAITDRMIVMRRMPEDRRLTRLVGAPDVGDQVRSIAKLIAAFHASAPAMTGACDIAGRDAVRGNWQGNHDAIEPLAGVVFDPGEVVRVRYLADRFLDHRGSLFARRLAEGFVRDGHGDLTAEDIFCLADGPRVLDCLAFDERLRVADVLADISFLVMDLDRLAGPGLSQDLMRWYCEFSNEHHPPSLAHHYVAYRAHVRAKVAAIRHQQGDSDAAELARTYLHLAARHLERARIQLVLIGGSPGTGKTTLARGVSDRMGFVVLGTDELRKDLTGRAHLEHERAAPGEGIYRSEVTERTYGALRDQARSVVDRGESVILDASWSEARFRADARQLASELGADLVEIECVLDPESAGARIADRLRAGDDPSDARPEILDALRARQEPWPEAHAVSTNDPLAATVDRTCELISAAG